MCLQTLFHNLPAELFPLGLVEMANSRAFLSFTSLRLWVAIDPVECFLISCGVLPDPLYNLVIAILTHLKYHCLRGSYLLYKWHIKHMIHLTFRGLGSVQAVLQDTPDIQILFIVLDLLSAKGNSGKVISWWLIAPLFKNYYFFFLVWVSCPQWQHHIKRWSSADSTVISFD